MASALRRKVSEQGKTRHTSKSAPRHQRASASSYGLTDRRTKLVCLLGLNIQGHTWSIAIAVTKESVKVVPTKAEAGTAAEEGRDEEEEHLMGLKQKFEVFGNVLLGHTRTVAGIDLNARMDEHY